jgi:hypothetical protein
VVSPAPEFIGCVGGTRGSETSQYPQEEKTKCDSVSSGERKRRRLNRGRVIPVRGCVGGVVGRMWTGLTTGRAVRKFVASRSPLESGAVDGDSPVGESCRPVWCVFPSSGGLLKSAVNLPGPPGKPKYFLMTDSARVP